MNNAWKIKKNKKEFVKRKTILLDNTHATFMDVIGHMGEIIRSSNSLNQHIKLKHSNNWEVMKESCNPFSPLFK